MDYTASGLQQRITVDVLDRVTRAELGELPGVSAVSIEKNLYNEYRMGGSLDVDLKKPISWRSSLVRIWLHLEHRGEHEKHPLLTGLPTVAGDTQTDTVLRLQAVLKDTTALLDDMLGRTWAYASGTVVTTAIQAVFTLLGIPESYVEPSTATLRTDASWPPDATYRKLINELADTIGYAAVWSDSMGVLYVQPYLSPNDRAEVFTLGWSRRSVTLPEVKREYPDEMPNHFILYTGDEAPLIAEGWNDDPDSPYSTVNQRVVPYTAQVDAADQATLNQQLATVMAQNREGSRTFEVVHRWFPIDKSRVIELQSAGRLKAPAYVYRGTAIQQELNVKVSLVQQSFSWAKGEAMSHVTTRLRGAE